VTKDEPAVLKQHSSTRVYHLLTKENKLSFSVFDCSKQMEVCFSIFRDMELHKVLGNFEIYRNKNQTENGSQCHLP
jgi:hypothetical protein